MRGDWDRGNIPQALIGRKFPETLSYPSGREIVTQRLGDTIFRLTDDTNQGPPRREYPIGTLVRLISDKGGARYSYTPGFNHNEQVVSVCSIDAREAEMVSARRETLEFFSPVPKRPLSQYLDDLGSILREVLEDPTPVILSIIEGISSRLRRLRSVLPQNKK